MNVIEALENRHSIRAFKKKDVDRETILKILEAANHSPSWANSQPWEIYVASGKPLERLKNSYLENSRNGVPMSADIPFPESWPEEHQKRIFNIGQERYNSMGIDRDDKEARNKIKEHGARFFDAPVVIFLCMNKGLSNWSLYDLGCVSQSLMLAAEHHGLNTVPAVYFTVYPELIRKELNISDNHNIVIGIALGYGDRDDIQNKYISPRRPIEEVVKFVGI